MVEATLAPRSSMAGGVLRQLHFRERLGVQVLAIWRGGRAYRSNLRDMRLEPGDAFLVMGSRDRLALLQDERDLLILTPVVKDVYRTEKAPWAALIMGAVLVPVLFGWLTIAVSAVCGVVVMVLAGCLKMDEAYRAIEWRAVFLIAGMIPLGAAMQDSGAASFLAEGVVGFLGPLGPWPVIVGLYLITAVATTIIPTAALVLLMAPITLQTCGELGVSPLTGMMAIAMAASASFTSPISHPANILVMGPGGYRFIDYLKLGIPLALVVFLAVFAVLPIFWPLHP
jgi:di/tricarboxylate transporter